MFSSRTPRLVVTSLIGAAVVLAGATAAGAGVLDQSQPVFGFRSVGSCGTSHAQTFTSGITGNLDQVDLGLFRFESNTTVPLNIEIQTVADDVPTGTVITSASVPASSVPSGPPATFVSVPLSTPAPVIAGNRYAIVLPETGTDCFSPAAYFWSVTDYDSYISGAALSFEDGNVRFESGDFTFKTYVASAQTDHCKHKPHCH